MVSIGDRHLEELSRSPDTKKEWEVFKHTIDAEIKNEVAGIRASGGPGLTWNARWLGSIIAIEETQENPQKYVGYIVEQRRSKGLPELIRDTHPQQ